MSIKTNHTTNEITLGTTTLAIDNNGVLVGTDQLANPINLGGIPVGTIIEAPSAPTDGVWLECDGSSYLRADYPQLEVGMPDALTWSQKTLPPTMMATWGVNMVTPGGAYLIDNDSIDVVYRTTDFVNYVPVLSGATNLMDVAAVGSTLVVLRYQSLDTWVSVDDGITWVAHNLATDNPTLGLSGSHSIIGSVNGVLFMAPWPGGNYVLASTDGVTFTKHTFATTTQRSILAVCGDAYTYVLTTNVDVGFVGVKTFVCPVSNLNNWAEATNQYRGFVSIDSGALVQYDGHSMNTYIYKSSVTNIPPNDDLPTFVPSGVPTNNAAFIPVFKQVYDTNLGDSVKAGYTHVLELTRRIPDVDVAVITHKVPNEMYEASTSVYNYAHSGLGKCMIVLDRYALPSWTNLPSTCWVGEKDPARFVTSYVNPRADGNSVYIKASN